MFLAMVSTTLDDVPICLARTEAEARKALRTLTRPQYSAILDILRRDGSGVVCGIVLEFNGQGALVRESCQTDELSIY